MQTPSKPQSQEKETPKNCKRQSLIAIAAFVITQAPQAFVAWMAIVDRIVELQPQPLKTEQINNTNSPK
jgi:hypothetical protein